MRIRAEPYIISGERPVLVRKRTRLMVSASVVLIFIGLTLSNAFVLAQGRTADSAQPVPSASVQHVITIVMENEEYSQVIGNPSAPYENALAANFTLLTEYYAIRHPSLPNYLAMVSGSTQDVSSDCLPSQCSTNASSIVDLLQSHGLTWKEYAESMPTNCSQTVSSDGLYWPKHDPFVYFSSITGNSGSGQTSAYCDSHVVSLAQFWTDLNANALPNYSFITPNICDDAHSCSLSTGDTWLSTVVPRIESSQEFSSTVLFVTYDESATSDVSGFGSAHGGHIPCIVVSPFVNRGYQSTVLYSHYSLLATTESLLGLGNLGKNDATAQLMSDVFGGHIVFALTPPTISVRPTTIRVGRSAILSTKTSFAGGASPYACQWLKESPSATGFSDLGSPFTTGCTPSSKPSLTLTSRVLTTSGTWSFELRVNDSASATIVSAPVTVTVKSVLSRTTVSCSPTSVPAASSKTITCKARVTGYLPTGTVSWSQSGTGSVSFVPTFRCACCTLIRGGCSVILTGVKSGKVIMTATYMGDSSNQGSSRTAKLTITNAPTTTTTTTTNTSTTSITSTQSGSLQGLVVRLGLNVTRMTSGATLEVTVSDYNPSSVALNFSKGSGWAVDGLATGWCPSLNLPVGIAVFQGRYTSANVSQATPLRIFPKVICPMVIRYITGYLFQPMSDNATVLPGSGETPMMAEVAVSGTYGTTGSGLDQLTPFSHGTYTVVAGDEWGNLAFAYFVVAS